MYVLVSLSVQDSEAVNGTRFVLYERLALWALDDGRYPKVGQTSPASLGAKNDTAWLRPRGGASAHSAMRRNRL